MKYERIKHLSIIIPIAFIVVMVSIIGYGSGGFEMRARTAKAQNADIATDQKDSDYDGLTDAVETGIYHTDPQISDTDKDGYYDAAEAIAGSDPLDASEPAGSIISTHTPEPSRLPWHITRASAITSFMMLFLIITLGFGMTTGLIYGIIPPVKAWSIHKFLSISLGIMVTIHIVSLLFDRFINFKLADILVPYHSTFKPASISLGIIGFYLLLLIIMTSLLIRLKIPLVWRSSHFLSYPIFIFSLIHGIYTGTDSKSGLMQPIYWITGIIFLLLMAYRFIYHLQISKSWVKRTAFDPR